MPHIHELYDFVVSAFIVHRGRVLLIYHKKYDEWLPIGGHVELDEDPEAPVSPVITKPAPPVRPTRKGTPNFEMRLTALEERCLLELVESKQRMALEDLRELRGEQQNVSAEERERQLDQFEAHWLKAARR